ncbi:MAG: ABC transporter permease, partial [Lawsonibacter sp.]|nr:ABC transporter permease [Lawsonibacter sp.]
PVEIVCFVPAILHLFQVTPAWLRYYPMNVCMDMISGHSVSAIGIFSVMAAAAVLFVFSEYRVLKMWDSMGGANL